MMDSLKHCTQINQVPVPEKLRLRYPFHRESMPRLRFVTSLFGGEGITPSTVTLLTGTPGSGKSTLIRQMAHALHSGPDCITLLNTVEESAEQTKIVCERLFETKEPTFYIGTDRLVSDTNPDIHLHYRAAARKGDLRTLLGHARTLRSRHPDKHLVMFIDSLQVMDDGKYPDGFINGQSSLRSLNLINAHCKSTFDSAVIIGQVTKNGDPAGMNKVMHSIDAWIHMYIDSKDRSETQGMRIIQCGKNRYGTGGRTHILNMQSDGLKEEGEFRYSE